MKPTGTSKQGEREVRLGFRHPALSLPVLRRRTCAALIDFVADVGEVMLTRGRSLTWNKEFRQSASYAMAMWRLRRAGLIAYRRAAGGEGVLRLTAAGRNLRASYFNPAPHWSRKWGGIWYLISYDVPEEERVYRDELRGFLARMRMGCLHGSVWVSPHDIRPEYADLQEAAAVDRYAFLFASRTVLGQSDLEVVMQAWPFEAILRKQTQYLAKYANPRMWIEGPSVRSKEMLDSGMDELRAYSAAMEDDPLLPRALWPEGYRGPEVYEAHRKWIENVASVL